MVNRILRKLNILLLGFLAFYILVLFRVPHSEFGRDPVKSFDEPNPEASQNSNTKVILFWSNWFGIPMAKAFNLDACPELQCKLTSDRDLISHADAVVFHMRDSKFENIIRKVNQIFVFLLVESPVYTNYDLKNYPIGYFNWTMTYRNDSDVPVPYGLLIKKDSTTSSELNPDIIIRDELWGTVKSNFSQLTQGSESWRNPKNKLGVWMTSNCHTNSKREKLFELSSVLKSELNVDIWGSCGDSRACPDSERSHCLHILSSDYKFYFAFENSVCKDYVTEKFWNIYGLNIVPIVLKREILKNYVPSNSFIALDDFASVKEFVTFIKYLDDNQTAYQEFIEAKTSGIDPFARSDSMSKYYGICKLCHKLWSSQESYVKIYENMHKWWTLDAKCIHDYVDTLF